MTAEQIHDALTLLPADLIAEADRNRTRKPKVLFWKRFAAMAACFALVFFAGGYCMLNFIGMGGSSAAAPTEAPAAEAPMMQESQLEPQAAGEKSSPAEAAPKAPEADSSNDICGLPPAPTEAANHNSTAASGGNLCIDHSHRSAEPEEDTTAVGWCGNMTATVYLEENTYTIAGNIAVTLTDILYKLNYTPEALCRCAPEFTADTEMGAGYEINLTEYFVRYDGGQAALTEEQAKEIAAIIERLT